MHPPLNLLDLWWLERAAANCNIHTLCSFQIQGSPVALGGDGSAADVDDWLYEFIDLLLFQASTKTADACIGTEAKRTRPIGNSVPIGEDQGRGSGQFNQRSLGESAHAIGVYERHALVQQGVKRVELDSKVG